MAAKYKYVGDGCFLPGIPARDLDDEDVAALSPEQRKDVKASNCYEEASAEKPAAKKEG